jgi:hypothetical protein
MRLGRNERGTERFGRLAQIDAMVCNDGELGPRGVNVNRKEH